MIHVIICTIILIHAGIQDGCSCWSNRLILKSGRNVHRLWILDTPLQSPFSSKICCADRNKCFSYSLRSFFIICLGIHSYDVLCTRWSNERPSFVSILNKACRHNEEKDEQINILALACLITLHLIKYHQQPLETRKNTHFLQDNIKFLLHVLWRENSQLIIGCGNHAPILDRESKQYRFSRNKKGSPLLHRTRAIEC